MSPALAGRFFTTEPPGKSVRWCFWRRSKGTAYRVKSVSNLKTFRHLFCVFSSQGSQSAFQHSLDIFLFLMQTTPHAELSIFSHILVPFVLTWEGQRPQRMETVAGGLQLLWASIYEKERLVIFKGTFCQQAHGLVKKDGVTDNFGLWPTRSFLTSLLSGLIYLFFFFFPISSIFPIILWSVTVDVFSPLCWKHLVVFVFLTDPFCLSHLRRIHRKLPHGEVINSPSDSIIFSAKLNDS